MEIKCPDCNQYISASSSACSHCGRAMTELPVASKPARVACSDGNCTGVVGDNGVCGCCRRTPEEINSEIKNKKPESPKTNPPEGVRSRYLWGKIINCMGWKGGLGVLAFLVIVLNLLNHSDPSTKTTASTTAPNTKEEVKEKFMFASKRCQTYVGPDKGSGLFFYSASAEKALTLDDREKYTIVKEQGDWVQVDVFGKTPWVEKNCMTNQIAYHKDTLKKNALVCRTKEQFNEFVGNRDNQAYTMNMLADDKCLVNVTNAEVNVDTLEGILPMVKVKVYWGDQIFIGWTDAIMIN